MGGLKKISLFMLYLVFSLSFAPYLTLGEIYSTSISGSDNALNAIRSSDNVVLRTTSILPVEVDFSSNGTFVSMTCNNAAPIACTYNKSITNQVSTLTVNLRETNTLQSAQVFALVDINAPSISSSTFSSAGNGVVASYFISDSSLLAGNCSGIKTVELFLNGRLASTQTHPPFLCNLNSNITGSIPNYLGSANTSLVVTDFMGYKANKTGTAVFFDSQPPKFSGSIILYKRGTNQRLTSIPPNATLQADLEVTILDDKLSLVYGDFSAFSMPGNLSATCVDEEDNGTSICRFSDVTLKIQGNAQKAKVFAVDSLGNLANLTSALALSFTPPRVSMVAHVQENFGDENITKIGGPNSTKPVVADIIFTVNYESSVGLSHVVADLDSVAIRSGSPTSTLSTEGISGAFLVASSPCNEISNTSYICIIRGARLKAKSQNTRINVSAVSDASSVTLTQVTLPLTVVMSAGTVNSITLPASQCSSGTCYTGVQNQQATATVSTSSSFNQSTITINGVEAICSAGPSSLICNATIPGSPSLALLGEDDYGNALRGQSRSTLVFDPSVPQITTPISVLPACPTAGQILSIKFNATDTGGSPGLILKADVSEISTQNITTGSCIGSAGKYVCSLSVNNIEDVEKNTYIKLMLSDLAANTFETNVPVSVCSLSTEVPNTITQIRTTGILPKIDRKVASKIPMKAPISLQIVPKSNSTIILERGRISCSGTPGASAPYLINEDSMNPILVISLKYDSSWEDASKLKINCTQEFKVREANKIYSNFEVENITAELELFNQPLGSLNDAYTQKVDELKKDLLDLDKGIRRKEKVDKYLGSVCKYAEALGKIDALVQDVKAAIWAVMVILSWVPGMDAAWIAVHKNLSGFHNAIATLIWPPGWIPTGSNSVGLAIKYTCTIYTCKMYDYNTYVSIGMDVAQTVLAPPDAILVKEEEIVGLDGRQVNKIRTYMNGDRLIIDINSDIGIIPGGSTVLRDSNDLYFDHAGQRTRIIISSNGKAERFEPSPIPQSNGNSPRSQTPSSSNSRPAKPLEAALMRGGTQTQNTQATAAASNPQRGFSERARNYFNKHSSSTIDYYGIREELLNTAVDAFLGDEENWIYNPYKSSRFDSMCFPATIFNAKKERELLCKKLGCINEMARTGGPIDACEEDFDLGYCMYVDSARYKLEGGMSFNNFMKGLFRQFSNNIVGLGVTSTYMFVVPGCAHYSMVGGDNLDISPVLAPGAWRATSCGVIGSGLALREFTALANNKFNVNSQNGAPTSLPPDATTFCNGVNYAS